MVKLQKDSCIYRMYNVPYHHCIYRMYNVPYHHCMYNRLPEEEPLGSKHVEDIKIKN
jgi:hypothetical protein